MKKIIPIIIVIVLVVGGTSGAFFILGNNNKSQSSAPPTNPNLVIKNLTLSRNNYEVVTLSKESIPTLPIVNVTVYSKGVAQFQLVIISPKNKSITLISEDIVGSQNITYPQKLSQYFDYLTIFTNPGTYHFVAELFNNSYVHKNISLIVYPALKINGYYTSPKIPVIGNPFKLFINVSGGISPYNIKGQFYIWNNSNYYYKFIGNRDTILLNQSGTWSLTINITDSLGFSIPHSTYNFVVEKNPFLVTVSAKYTSVDVNVTDTLVVSIKTNSTYNISAYHINWVMKSLVIGHGKYLNISFKNTGIYHIHVIVNCSKYVSIPAIIKIDVNPSLKIKNIFPEYPIMDLGMLQYYQINVSGGTLGQLNNLNVNYSVNNKFVYDAYLFNNSQKAWFSSYFSDSLYLVSGNDTITLEITDYGGGSLWYNFSILVNPDLNASIGPVPNNITVNQTLTFYTECSNGTPPYTIIWNITDPNYNTITLYGQFVNYTVKYSGFYLVEVTVEDVFGTIFFGGKVMLDEYLYVTS